MNRSHVAMFAMVMGLAASAFSQSAGSGGGGAAADESAVAAIRKEADAMEKFVASPLAKEFLRAAELLPHVETRVFFRSADKKNWYSPDAAAKLPEQERATLEERKLDGAFYYTTRYGTPIAYVRPIDLIAAAGFDDVKGKHILDFGYGGIGHLRLLASLGADVVGVEVDSLLPLLYGQPGDQGTIQGRGDRKGTLRLANGRWPAEAEVKAAVGGGYDFIISKNVLKHGYIHPARPVDERMLVKLGVDDEAFVRAVYEALKPGGWFMIYNLSPAPSPPDKPYIPWSDGMCPFERSVFESTGFEVKEFDKDDTDAAREMGRILGWGEGEGAMDLQNDLFGHYTLVRKPLK